MSLIYSNLQFKTKLKVSAFDTVIVRKCTLLIKTLFLLF